MINPVNQHMGAFIKLLMEIKDKELELFKEKKL